MPIFNVEIQNIHSGSTRTVQIAVDQTPDDRFTGGKAYYATNLAAFGCGKNRATELDAIQQLVGDHNYRVVSHSLKD